MFSEHGTLIQPDALKYITSKENPNEFADFLIKNMKEYPLILTVDNIKFTEQSTNIQKLPAIDDKIIDKKEFQNKILSKIFNSNIILDEVIDKDEKNKHLKK